VITTHIQQKGQQLAKYNDTQNYRTYFPFLQSLSVILTTKITTL